jgi:Zn-dependent protease/CBS domain-containing protein
MTGTAGVDARARGMNEDRVALPPSRSPVPDARHAPDALPGMVARIGGIPIVVHPSWLVVFALISSQLAMSYLPGEHPGWPTASYWLAGTSIALLLFVSVIVHELGHAWVARRNGIAIRSITLFIFGGVARVAAEPDTPSSEFRVAIAGPLMSVVLAGVFRMAAMVAGDGGLLAATCLFLARTNLTLALFNLAPGLPLDGGRVVRAIVWRATGDSQRATAAAALGGQIFALGLMGVGGGLAVAMANVGGLWLVLIGWFLYRSAGETFAQAALRRVLAGVSVGQVMAHEGARVPRALSLDRLVEERVLTHGDRCFLVTDDDQLLGLVTLHEVNATPRERWPAVRVDDVMRDVGQLVTVRPDEGLLAALAKMDEAQVAQMPVVSGGALLGLISREDVLHYVRTRLELAAPGAPDARPRAGRGVEGSGGARRDR